MYAQDLSSGARGALTVSGNSECRRWTDAELRRRCANKDAK